MNPWVIAKVRAWDISREYEAQNGHGINVPSECPMISSAEVFQVFTWNGEKYAAAVIPEVKAGFAGGGRTKAVAAFGTLKEAKGYVEDQGPKVVIKRPGESFHGTEGVLLGRSKPNGAHVDIKVQQGGRSVVVECHNIFVHFVDSGEWINANQN